MRSVLFTAIAASVPLARAHIAFFTTAMWGWDVHSETYPYDNRPETPLQNYTFDKWWFHGHLDHPPQPGNFFELPAGDTAISQTACNKGATKYWASSEGSTDIRDGENPCPGYPMAQYHGYNDLKGCALSIAYTSDVNSIKPEDLAIFTVNHECVWKVNTAFSIPKDMPPCPEGGCICAWHWIHSADSGSAQMYMNGFRCNVTGSTSNTPIMKPEVPKRCTGDLSKCNQGAQQPSYWWQNERNNMPNGQYDPPFYLDEWGFTNGAQNGIFGGGDHNTSTPADKSSSTPPAESNPSSTPTPTPTPGTPTNGGDGGDPPKSSPSPPPANSFVASPSPLPTNNSYPDPQGDSNSSTETNSANHHPPSPSKKPRCKNKKAKKRRDAVARHLKQKREHNH